MVPELLRAGNTDGFYFRRQYQNQTNRIRCRSEVDHFFLFAEYSWLQFFSGSSGLPQTERRWKSINYDGELSIIHMIENVLRLTDNGGKLAFKNQGWSNEDAPKFKVTLGVVPDYAFEGGNYANRWSDWRQTRIQSRIDAGDIVIQLGDIKCWTWWLTWRRSVNSAKAKPPKSKSSPPQPGNHQRTSHFKRPLFFEIAIFFFSLCLFRTKVAKKAKKKDGWKWTVESLNWYIH